MALESPPSTCVISSSVIRNMIFGFLTSSWSTSKVRIVTLPPSSTGLFPERGAGPLSASALVKGVFVGVG